MTEHISQMRREIEEIPAAVSRLLDKGASVTAEVAREIARRDPRFLVSVARGTSDHACSFLKYASELLFGVPMASVGPSVASIYGASLQAEGSVCLAVSQSGQSPDIVALAQDIRKSGAYTIAVTNHAQSPLADSASATIDLHAGPELSVAATKTFVNSLVAGLWLFAEWKEDDALRSALRTLPDALAEAVRCDWSAVAGEAGASSLFTLGRGLTWAISNEAALKFKETCQIHAESFSSAEVLHGPVSIVDARFPVVCFAAADAAEPAVVDVADALARKDARVFVTSDGADVATVLPTVRTDHWMTDPISLIVSFYALVEQVARQRGIDPDAPRHLRKVTETV